MTFIDSDDLLMSNAVEEVMFEKNLHLPENTVTAHKVMIEEARDYRMREHDERKFIRRYRMKRLDRFEKAFAQRLFEMVGSDSHILDIPCGNGRFFENFLKAGKLTMADYSVNMLKVCEERFGAAENVELIQADISSVPLADNSVDLCFCMRLFHHMKNDEIRLAGLKELARVSKKYVALSFYNRNYPGFYWRKTLGKKIRGNYVSFAHIVSLAGQVGLVYTGRFPKLNLLEKQCLVIFVKE